MNKNIIYRKFLLPLGEGKKEKCNSFKKTLDEGIWILAIVWLLFFSCSSFAFTFIAFGDNRDGDQTFQTIIAKVNQEKDIAFAVNTGDLVSSGTRAQYKNYLKLTEKCKIPIINVLGNHDAVNGGWKIFVELFGFPYRSFDYENSHFIVLDNSFNKSFDNQQFNWLRNDLVKNAGKKIFVFMHKPLFDPSETYADHVMSSRQLINELTEMFERFKVRYVIAGHIHGYGKSERNGVVYIVTGGAGAPLHVPNNLGGFNHYVKIKVDGNKISDQVVRVYE